MRRVLQLGAYRRLLLGTLLNQLAYEISVVALSLLVYRRTGSALGAAGFFLCSEFGPAVIGPVIVARVDQLPARLILTLLYAAEVVVFALLAWTTHHFSVAAVLALTLVMGSLALVARVISRTAWTAITSAVGLLREAQAVTNTTSSIAFMVGPAIGGGVVALSGTLAALLVNAGVFLVMALNIVSARGLPEARAVREPLKGRLRAALSYANTQPLLRRLLGLQTGAMLFFSISIPVEVVFARQSLHTNAGGYGGLLAAWGAGAIVGSAAYARWRRLPSRAMIVTGTALLMAGFGVMAAAPDLAVAISGAVVAGIGNGIQIVAVRTALQDATDARWMALIVSINESLLQGVPGAGILIGGGITAAGGPRVALAVGAIGSLVVAVAMRLGLPRRMEHETPEPASQQELRDPETGLAASTTPRT